MQKITVTVSVRISVTGDVSQIPSIPHIVGKTKIVMSRIKIPRRKAITADCFGQLMEVKYIEPATLILKSMHNFFSFAPKQKLTRGDIPSQSPIAIILKIKIEYPRIVKEATPFSPTYFNKTKL